MLSIQLKPIPASYRAFEDSPVWCMDRPSGACEFTVTTHLSNLYNGRLPIAAHKPKLLKKQPAPILPPAPWLPAIVHPDEFMVDVLVQLSAFAEIAMPASVKQEHSAAASPVGDMEDAETAVVVRRSFDPSYDFAADDVAFHRDFFGLTQRQAEEEVQTQFPHHQLSTKQRQAMAYHYSPKRNDDDDFFALPGLCSHAGTVVNLVLGSWRIRARVNPDLVTASELEAFNVRSGKFVWGDLRRRLHFDTDQALEDLFHQINSSA